MVQPFTQRGTCCVTVCTRLFSLSAVVLTFDCGHLRAVDHDTTQDIVSILEGSHHIQPYPARSIATYVPRLTRVP